MSSHDEILSEAVRKYPCLYDKGKKSHKDKLTTINAWKKVGEECQISHEEAKRSFENLKRRFAKRRKKINGPSGSSTSEMADAKDKYRELAYLAWLEPHTQLRSTKTNCPAFKQVLATVDEDEDSSSEDDKENRNDDNDEVNIENVDVRSSTDDITPDIMINTEEDLIFTPLTTKDSKRQKKNKTTSQYISDVTKRTKWHQKNTTVEDAQINFFKSAQKAMECPSPNPSPNPSPVVKQDSDNVIFGQYIASQLDQLPMRFQREARHEINNILYSVQNRAEYQTDQQVFSNIPQTSQLQAPMTPYYYQQPYQQTVRPNIPSQISPGSLTYPQNQTVPGNNNSNLSESLGSPVFDLVA